MMKNKVHSISSISLHKKLHIATANQRVANYERNKKRHDDFYALMTEKSDEHLNIELEYFEKKIIVLYH